MALTLTGQLHLTGAARLSVAETTFDLGWNESEVIVDYKILLADDSVTVQKIITLTFTDEGVDVIAVNNGDEAINRLRSLRPALVMADISIPGKNGYEICEYVKSRPEIKDTPVILLVPAFEPFDEERAGRVGADCHLTKPFQSIRMLISTVKNLMDRNLKNLMDRNAVAEIPVAGPDLTTARESYQNNSDPTGFDSKRAKIDELIRRSAQAASENGVENGTLLNVNPRLGNGRYSDSPFFKNAPSTCKVEIKEDANMDNILELDDIFPNPTPIQAMGQIKRSDANIDRAQAQPPAGPAPYEIQERMVIPNGIIDEIVNRVSAQLFERLSGEIARRIAPEIAELVRRQLFSDPDPALAPFRESENLLDID